MGLLTEIFLSRLKLPRDIHRFAFRKYATRVVLRFPDKTITFAYLQDRSYRLVQALEAAGLKTGDNLFAQVEAGPAFFENRKKSPFFPRFRAVFWVRFYAKTLGRT